MLLNEEQIANFPVQHFSPSGIKTYLEDRQNFFKNNIRFEFDNFTKPAFIIGGIVHEVLEAYYESVKDKKKFDWTVATDIAFDSAFLELKDEEKIQANYSILAEIVNFFKIPEGVDIRDEDIMKAIDNTIKNANTVYLKPEWFSSKKEIEDVSSKDIVDRFIELKQEVIDEDLKVEIRWDKTLSTKDECREIVDTTIRHYIEELPKDIHEIVCTEEKLFGNFEDLNGEQMPIPLKGVVDLVWKDKEGNIIIEDHKTSGKLKDQLEDQEKFGSSDPGFEIQAVAYWFLVRSHYGVNPTKMVFRQILKKENPCPLKKPELVELCSKAGVETKGLLVVDMKKIVKEKGLWKPDPHVKAYEVVFNEGMIQRFLEIYRRIVTELSGQPLITKDGQIQFLPNPFRMWGGEDSWKDFCEEVKIGGFNIDDIKAKREEKYIDVDYVDFDEI